MRQRGYSTAMLSFESFQVFSTLDPTSRGCHMDKGPVGDIEDRRAASVHAVMEALAGPCPCRPCPWALAMARQAHGMGRPAMGHRCVSVTTTGNTRVTP
jgi:hypothetical protein